MATRRVADEPAYVLHRYDWSESSLILEIFTRHHGRVALVAKGAKRPSSSFRPILLPLQPLAITYGGDAEIRTLKSAEWQGGHVMPSGDALFSGYYLNELLLKLLARDDPHPALFDIYARVVHLVTSEHGDVLQAVLRTWELLLLREVGVLPQLDRQTMTMEALLPHQRYTLVAEGGLRSAGDDERHALLGAEWCVLQAALDNAATFTATLQACAALQSHLKPLLRAMLHYHCGVKTLRTRQMMMEIQAL